jgi:autotransporter-associated beta strand protein
VHINNGVLIVGAGGTTGSLSGNVTNNGFLSFNRSDDVTFGGRISGTGSLIKLGAGTLALTGANTYSGPTNINAGTLRAVGGNGIGDNSAVAVAAGATLALEAARASSETIGSLAGAGTVQLNGQTLRTGNDNTSSTFAGSIDGTGAVVKIGTGTLRLSGASTSTGILSVTGGTLDAAGTVPMLLAIQPPATVIGTGTVGAMRNFGRVAPGNSVGTLTVTGNYNQAPSGTLDIEIRPDGSAADLLAVGGTATLAGTLTAGGENGVQLTPVFFFFSAST